MSPAPQQTNSVVFDTSMHATPTGTLQPQDLTGLPAQETATAAPTSSPSSTSNANTASLLDTQSHGSGKSVGIAVGIATGIVLLVILSTILLFCSRKRKQAKLAERSEARLLRRSQIEDAPPPYLPSKHQYHSSMQKGDLPATPTRPQRMLDNERALVRSDTAPSMPMTHVTEGSWTTLPTMPTQPTPPMAYMPGRLAPLPNTNMPSRFST